MNARALESKGAALLVRDVDCLTEAVPAALKLLADGEQLAAMRRNIKALARPNAAEDIVDQIIQLLEK